MTSYRQNFASRQSSKQQLHQHHSTSIADSKKSRRRAQTKTTITFIKDGSVDSNIELIDQDPSP